MFRLRLTREISQLTNESLSAVVASALGEQAERLTGPAGRGARLGSERHTDSILQIDSHYGDRDEPYRFLSVDRLLADFRDDCARLAGWRWE